MKMLRVLRWFLPSLALMRLTTYLSVAFLAAALLAARSLRADVTEAAMAAGHELAKLADLLGDSESIIVNGERLHHSSTYVDQDVATVLARLEAYCGESPSVVGRALRELPPDAAAKAERLVPDAAVRRGFIRQVDGQRAMVACFVDDQPSGMKDLGNRIRRFLRTKHLGEFGRFRYVYAEGDPEGGKTHVIASWADTSIDIGAMFPATGDAAGGDSPLVPRPPEARRTFTAAVEGHPHAVRMYTTPTSAAAVLRHYDEWMSAHQFVQVDGAHDRAGTSAYIRSDGYQAYVTIGDRDGLRYVSLIESGRANGLNMATIELSND